MKRGRGIGALLLAVGTSVLLVPSGSFAAPFKSCSTAPPSGPITGPRKGGSVGPDVSADGRYISFMSWDPNLVSGDINKSVDVFRYDRMTKQLLRVSTTPDGGDAAGGAFGGSMSGDGTRVGIYSASADLGVPHVEGGFQTYVKDIRAGQLLLVSATPEGAATSGHAYDAVLSDDGRFAAFSAQSVDLVSVDTPASTASSEVYVRDLEEGTTIRVSVSPSAPSAPTNSFAGAVSSGGQYVVFNTDSDLAPGDSNGFPDVVLWDRSTDAYELVTSAAPLGGSFAGMSDDGRIVAYSSLDSEGRAALFVRDRTAGTTRKATLLDAAGSQFRLRSSVSGNGEVVAAVVRSATGADDTNNVDDIVLVELASGITRRSSISTGGCQANADSANPALSYDGSVLGFDSLADNLVPADNSGNSDVFVRDDSLATTVIVSRAGHNG